MRSFEGVGRRREDAISKYLQLGQTQGLMSFGSLKGVE